MATNQQNQTAPEMKKTLSLMGLTINAMALIAPGAFLWLTFQLQAAQVDPSGVSTAPDIWTGLFLALILSFLTAASYSWLSRRYPDAGAAVHTILPNVPCWIEAVATRPLETQNSS